MENTIIVPISEINRADRLVNDSHEFAGVFLGKWTSNGLYILEGKWKRGSELHAGFDPQHLVDYASFCSDYPGHIIVPAHMHNRRFGELVQSYDPYWSVGPDLDDLHYPRGSIVEDFFITLESISGGDNHVAEWFHRRGLDYHLFFHPSHGSEGQIMNSKHATMTAYRYDPNSIGRVRGIGVALSRA